MNRLKFIVDCLPYSGIPDDARQQGVGQFLATELAVAPHDVDFAEVAIADAAQTQSLVQPGLVVYRSPHADADGQRAFVLQIAEAAQAIGLFVVRVSVQQIGSYAAHALAAGGAVGTAVGGGVGDRGDSRTAGMFLGAVLGALIGGAIGSAIAKDGPVLGIWQRDADGIWRWQPAAQFLPEPVGGLRSALGGGRRPVG